MFDGMQKHAFANKYFNKFIKFTAPVLVVTSSGCQNILEKSHSPISKRGHQEQICLNKGELPNYQEFKGTIKSDILAPFAIEIDPDQLKNLSKNDKKTILDKALCESEKIFNKYAQSIRSYARKDKVVANKEIEALRNFYAPAIQKLYLVQLNNNNFKYLSKNNIEINDLFIKETGKAYLFYYESFSQSNSEKLFINLNKFTKEQMEELINNKPLMQDLLNTYKSFDKSLDLNTIKEIVKNTNIYYSNEFNNDLYGAATIQNNILLNENRFKVNGANFRENILRNELSHILYREIVLSKELNMRELTNTDESVFQEHTLKTEFISDAIELLSKDSNLQTNKRILLATAKFIKKIDLGIPQYHDIYKFYDKSLRKNLGDESTDELYEYIIRLSSRLEKNYLLTKEDLYKEIDLSAYGSDLWTQKIPEDFSKQAKLELEKIRKFYDDIEKQLSKKTT